MTFKSTLTKTLFDDILSSLESESYSRKRTEKTRLEVCDKVADHLNCAPSLVVDVATEGALSQHYYTELEALELAELAKAEEKRQKEIQAIIAETGSVESRLSSLPRMTNKRGYIVTSAQNETGVNTGFLANLKAYADFLGYDLLISGFAYSRNKEFAHSEKNSVHWVKDVKPYLTNSDVWLSDNLLFAAGLNISPTAKLPLSGLEGYAMGADIIVPHTRIALQSHNTPKKVNVKIHYATGAVTLRNYIQKKAGQVADVVHNFAACIVDLHTDGHNVRHLEAKNNGTFFDYYQESGIVYKVSGGEVAEVRDAVKAVTMGDLHSEKAEQPALNATYAMLDNIRPEHLFLHDTLDFESRNHHNRNDKFFLAKTEQDTVLADLLHCHNIVSELKQYAEKTILIESNHDLALEIWLKDQGYNPAYDSKNARLWHSLNAAIYGCIEEGKPYHNLELGLRVACSLGNVTPDFSGLTFHTVDDSYIVEGIEQGQHGHIGTGGSRGNITQFAKLGYPVNIGHGHRAHIYYPAFMSGVMGFAFGYNKGNSDWSVSHTLTFEGGTRQIVTLLKS